MLIEFYKLRLTPLPTADWILNKHSQVDESRAASARAAAGSAALARAQPPPNEALAHTAKSYSQLLHRTGTKREATD